MDAAFRQRIALSLFLPMVLGGWLLEERGGGGASAIEAGW